MRAAIESGEVRQIAWATFHLALLLQQQGHGSESRRCLEDALARGREAGDDRLIGNTLNSLGEAARIEGDWATARSLYEQSIEAHRRLNHPVGVSVTLSNLGAALCEEGDLEAARSCYVEALPALFALGNKVGLSFALDGMGAVAAKRGEWTRAAQLAGAAEALRAAVGSELEPADRVMRARYLAAVRERLGEEALGTALGEGRALAHEAAVELALST
jgi:tetratricopeptide (TPR) repeat protein